MSKDEIEKKVEETLELVGIPKARKVEYPYQFSGGMRQRVVIAIALVCNPALLIADEPTTALDVTIQAQILTMICNLQRKYGTSVIMITHDLGVVADSESYRGEQAAAPHRGPDAGSYRKARGLLVRSEMPSLYGEMQEAGAACL